MAAERLMEVKAVVDRIADALDGHDAVICGAALSEAVATFIAGRSTARDPWRRSSSP
jgi:hypothetical protein